MKVPGEAHSTNPSADPVAFARMINARWIVHGGLDRDAEDYLKYLITTAPSRFERSCQNACLMLRSRDSTEDPKPWFYAGWVSLASAEEANRFLGAHRVIHAAVSPAALIPEDLPPAVMEKIHRIRAALAQLPP
jgi:hypothetical protein